MEVWQTPKQSWPVLIIGALIRWRVEILVTVVAVVVILWLNNTVGTVWTLVCLAVVLLIVAVWPGLRRFVVYRVWCVLDRHRIRTCLRNAKFRTMNLDGALPFMLWARPTKTGERVWLWTRAGSSPDELDNVLSHVASACFAREARVHHVRKMTTVVAFEIIRRDPLEKSGPVESPLAKLSAKVHGRVQDPEGVTPLTAVNVTQLHPTPVAVTEATDTNSGKSEKPGKSRKNTSTNVTPERPAVVVGGEDLSDYID
ncbi:hypothetical protein [Tamaricihabitans halophyticus]|nr:hypothetical protein [Tamaricihabitans halophyticus]